MYCRRSFANLQSRAVSCLPLPLRAALLGLGAVALSCLRTQPGGIAVRGPVLSLFWGSMDSVASVVVSSYCNSLFFFNNRRWLMGGIITKFCANSSYTSVCMYSSEECGVSV